MSTQLKNCKFSDKVLKEDANKSVGNFTAGNISANEINAGNINVSGQINADTISMSYLSLGGHTYSLYVNDYGYLALAQKA